MIQHSRPSPYEIFGRKNEVVFHKKSKAPHLVLEIAKSKLLEYLSAKDSGLQKNISTIRELIRCSLSGLGKINLNWHALVDTTSKRMGIGIIIRGNRGDVMACLSQSRPFSSQPFIAECQALLRAMKFFLELSFYQVTLEGDALVITEAIKNENNCLGCYSDLIEEENQSLRTRPQWSLSFSLREGN